MHIFIMLPFVFSKLVHPSLKSALTVTTPGDAIHLTSPDLCTCRRSTSSGRSGGSKGSRKRSSSNKRRSTSKAKNGKADSRWTNFLCLFVSPACLFVCFLNHFVALSFIKIIYQLRLIIFLVPSFQFQKKTFDQPFQLTLILHRSKSRSPAPKKKERRGWVENISLNWKIFCFWKVDSEWGISSKKWCWKIKTVWKENTKTHR